MGRGAQQRPHEGHRVDVSTNLTQTSERNAAALRSKPPRLPAARTAPASLCVT
jgi:hypothetical protein